MAFLAASFLCQLSERVMVSKQDGMLLVQQSVAGLKPLTHLSFLSMPIYLFLITSGYS